MSEVETAARMQDRKDKLRWIDGMVFHSLKSASSCRRQ